MDKEELKNLISDLKRFRANASEGDSSKDYLVPSYELQTIDDAIAILEEQHNIQEDI